DPAMAGSARPREARPIETPKRRAPPPLQELERAQERHEIDLLLVRELHREHEIEELDRVLEREQPVVVQVGRRVLDAAQRECLDRAIRRAEPAVDQLLLEKPVALQL